MPAANVRARWHGQPRPPPASARREGVGSSEPGWACGDEQDAQATDAQARAHLASLRSSVAASMRDVISGFFLILEDQVRVGDMARINNVTGLIDRLQRQGLAQRHEHPDRNDNRADPPGSLEKDERADEEEERAHPEVQRLEKKDVENQNPGEDGHSAREHKGDNSHAFFGNLEGSITRAVLPEDGECATDHHQGDEDGKRA